MDTFTYLGSAISKDLTIDRELNTRVGKAATMFNRLRKRAWDNTALTIKTKCRIYHACVISVLLYCCETWTTYRRHEKRLNAFHMRCLRRILGVSWRDHVSNEAVLEATGSSSLFSILKTRRLRWLGHVHRMSETRLPRQILFGELSNGARHRGRPKLRLKDVLKRDLNHLNIPTNSWQREAENRPGWRKRLHDGGQELDSNWLAQLNQIRQRRHARTDSD